MIAATPEPPYTVVLFTSLRRPADHAEYAQVAARMGELVQQEPGFLGVESARDAEGFGITLSYWKDEAAALAWKRQAEHREAQRLGRDTFYARYALRVATVSSQSFFGEGS